MASAPPTDQDILALAGDYANPDADAWMAIVEKSLGGKPYAKLTKKTYDGLPLKPLYTEAEDGGLVPAAPGTAPYVRGHSALGQTQDGWDIRCLSSHPDPKEANRQILADLEKGATSVWLKLDPTGQTGTVVKSRADIETMLDGVYLDLAPVILDPGGPSLPPAAYLMALLEDKGIPAEAFNGNFGADPLSTLAAVGKVIVPMETLLGRMADLAAYTSKTYPNAKALNIATTVYHNAGCSEVQELAIAMATAVVYLRHMTDAGLSIDEACGQVAFTFTADADVFLSAAKLRVARRLWARVAEACGAGDEQQKAPIYAVTAPRMMSQRDPWVNILRGTAACFAAAVGGADATTVLPYESAIGLPTDFGRRIARNTQVILQEESFLNRVADPAGGAWLMESLTEDLASSAWSLFQEIEANGGLAAALQNASLAEQIAAIEVARASNIATRKEPLTGISEFPDVSEAPVETDSPDLQAIVSAADARAEEAKAKIASLPNHDNGALMAALVDAARNNASSSTIGASLRGTPTEITPLPQHRLAEHYEALRDASDRWTEDYGQRPHVFLANMGSVADFTARATFAKNLVEAGGMEVIAGPGGGDVTDIIQDFARSGARIVVLCATDSIYKDKAAGLAAALKAVDDAALIIVAGKPDNSESALRGAGVSDFIFMGCDVLAVLKGIHAHLGISS